MIKDFLPYIGLLVSLGGFIVVLFKLSRESKDRQRSELERQISERTEAERKGIEEGRRLECEERMRISIDSAHNKIRAIESTMQSEKQRQSEQFTEMNMKLDNLMTLVSRIESDIVRRLERLEDAG